MNKKTALWVLFLTTPLFFLVTHAIAYLAHEYCHSFSAWAFGFKLNPFDLNYGDTSLRNILLLEQVSENVNFDSFKGEHPWLAALVALAGFGIGNVLLFILSIITLRKKSIHSSIYYYFFLWLAVMNLGNFIDYVPGRTFATHGDVQEIVSFLNISPWWIMVLLGYPICYSFRYFYDKVLPYSYVLLELNRAYQAILLLLITFTLFVLFGTAGAEGYGEISHFIALLSIYISPIVIVACWPWRRKNY